MQSMSLSSIVLMSGSMQARAAARHLSSRDVAEGEADDEAELTAEDVVGDGVAADNGAE